MGCDIHMWAEVKKTYPNPKVKPAWRTVGRVFKDDYYSKNNTPTLDIDGYEWNKKFTEEPYGGRNYNLFGFLANVRNGFGFAGVDTGNEIKPISLPKGLPKDVSDYIKKQSDDWGVDGHSHSWLTIEELEKADWDKVITKRGVVSEAQYKYYLKHGKPRSLSGDVCGGNIIVLTEKEYKQLKKKDKDKRYFVKIEWKDKLKEYCGDFYKKTLPALRKLLENTDVSDVRIVFLFDN